MRKLQLILSLILALGLLLGAFAEDDALEIIAEPADELTITMEDEADEEALGLWEEPSATPTPEFAANEVGDSVLSALPNYTSGSFVNITKPADGSSLFTGSAELWCVFNNSGGFSSDDLWKYTPVSMQLFRDGALVDSRTFSGFNQLVFAGDGIELGTLDLSEPGSYTIRVSAPGSADIWDTSTFNVIAPPPPYVPTETVEAPEPETPRQPLTDDNLVEITSPAQGEHVEHGNIPVWIRFRKPDSGIVDESEYYNGIDCELYNSCGEMVDSMSISLGRSSTEKYLKSLEEFYLVNVYAETGGNYTLRVKLGSYDVWDSVKFYVEGPAIPDYELTPDYILTPKQSEYTIDLTKSDKVRVELTLSKFKPLDKKYIDYIPFVAYGDTTIAVDGKKDYWLEDYDFDYDSDKKVWVTDGYVNCTGLKVGKATLHLYISVNGTKQYYNHQAVTINVIESPKPTLTPKPTATPKATATPTTSAKPTATPKATAKPTATPKLTATPKPTASVKPTATPKPTAAPKATKVMLNKTGTVSLAKGKSLTLKATVLPKGASQSVTWSSSNAKIAKVSKTGKVTGVKPGTVTITAKTANGKKASVKVKVYVAPTKVVLNKKGTVTLKKGKTLALKATVTPKGAEATITWTTSDKKVATVDKNGNVKAIKPGTATITAKTINGKKATVKIKVK